MNQNKQKNKIKEFDGEMDFYVPLGAIVIELEDIPAEVESKNPNYTIVQYALLESED